MTSECLGRADGYGFANIFDAKTSRLSRRSVRTPPCRHAKSPFYVVITIQKITDPEAYNPFRKGKSRSRSRSLYHPYR